MGNDESHGAADAVPEYVVVCNDCNHQCFAGTEAACLQYQQQESRCTACNKKKKGMFNGAWRLVKAVAGVSFHATMAAGKFATNSLGPQGVYNHGKGVKNAIKGTKNGSGHCGGCGGNRTCRKCSGSGQVSSMFGKKTCKRCSGSGGCPYCNATGVCANCSGTGRTSGFFGKSRCDSCA